MCIKIVKVLILTIMAFSCLMVEFMAGNEFFLQDIFFYAYFILIILDLCYTKTISVFSLWIVAYLFVIQSDILISLYERKSMQVDHACFFLSLSNISLLLGYSIRQLFYNKNMLFNKTTNNTSLIVKNLLLFDIVLFGLYALFIYSSIQNVILVIALGRLGEGEGSALGSFSILESVSNILQGILPSLLSFYLYRIKGFSKLIVIIICIPIIAIVAILGSRYMLLFSALPVLLITDILSLNKITLKKIFGYGIVGAIFIFISSFMVSNRSHQLADWSFNASSDYKVEKSIPKSVALSQSFSPEDCVQMMVYSDRYFENHDLHYGRESGFIFYFWIPRFVWPNKPTMLDNWLIRQYENVPDNFSSASSFVGELKADFGYFAFFILFIIGLSLYNYNQKIVNISGNMDIRSIYLYMSIPVVFFAVRSPVLSLYTYISQVIVLYIIFKIFFRKTII